MRVVFTVYFKEAFTPAGPSLELVCLDRAAFVLSTSHIMLTYVARHAIEADQLQKFVFQQELSTA